jgi:branched-chain amino acid transport system ATP-binding protein
MKLQVADLNSFYGPAHILFDIALEVGEGEVVALLGRNGAGKSTTFRSIVGLVENRSGRIVFEARMSPANRRTRSCAAGSATCRKSGASSRT